MIGVKKKGKKNSNKTTDKKKRRALLPNSEFLFKLQFSRVNKTCNFWKEKRKLIEKK